jgi:alkylation response protein AidB-like acyl-CoA dehydrogenase
MEFSLTEEQERLQSEVVAFSRQELNDDVILNDTSSSLSRESWKKCAGLGIQGLPIPEMYGGSESDPITIAVVLEALGYGCTDNGLIFSMNAQMWSCEIPILKFGTEKQKKRYLPGLCDGSLIGVQAMSEPDSGSDAFSLRTSAAPNEDGYILKGTKTFITNAPIADVFVVFASTDRSLGFAGISAFLVERGTPGLEVGSPFHKMGLRTSPMSELVLSDCQVPEDALLGPKGAGMAVFNTSMDWERSFILTSALGTMRRQLERSVSYARERKQFGQPIGKFQAVSHRLVEMKLRLETGRLLVFRLAWLKGLGRPTAMESAMAKLYLSECFLQSSLDALQVHGGYGYMTESELERDVRDAVAGRIYSGTSDIHKNIIARHMGL